jgi:excisionase family DNA binding protein
MTSTPEPLLTTDQVADLLQISRRSVERLEESGQLLSVRIGRLVRYRSEDVDAFISRKSA